MVKLNGLIANLYVAGALVAAAAMGYGCVKVIQRGVPYAVDRRHYKELLTEITLTHQRLKQLPFYLSMSQSERIEMLFSFAYPLMVRQHQLRPFSYLDYMIEYLEEDVPTIVTE